MGLLVITITKNRAKETAFRQAVFSRSFCHLGVHVEGPFPDEHFPLPW